MSDPTSPTPPTEPSKINATVPDPANLDTSYKPPKEDEIVPTPSRASKSGNDLSRLSLMAMSVLIGLLSLGGAAYYLLAGGGSNLLQTSPQAQDATIVLIEGEVQTKTPTDAQWMNATSDQAFPAPMLVKTGENGRAVVRFKDKSEIRMRQNSVIELSEIISNKLLIKQVIGETYHRVTPDSRRLYQVDAKGLRIIAEGTAFNIQETSPTSLTVYATEGKVSVGNSNDIEQLINAGEEAQAQTAPGVSITAAKTDPQLYSGDWFQFNKQRDTDQKFSLGVFANSKAPTLTISAPRDNTSTKNESVTVNGKTDIDAYVKIKLRDSIQSIQTNKGNFSFQANLQDGDNNITIQAFNPGGILSEKTIKVVKLVATPTPTRKPSADPNAVIFDWDYLRSTTPGKISAAWKVRNLDTSNGFMIIYSRDTNPQYPPRANDVLIKISNGGQRSITWDKGLLDAGGSFNVRVCRYIAASDSCAEYTSNQTVNVAATEYGAASISATATQSSGRSIRLDWAIAGGAAPNGYKIVWGNKPNPTFPQNQATAEGDNLLAQVLGENTLAQTDVGLSWGSDTASNPASISKTITIGEKNYAAGLWYIRVCRIRGNVCDIYSNQMQVTVTD